jgi:mersacidin/lichenicidin family type 2 lantibiotic
MMHPSDVVRVWKDPAYRSRLDAAELAVTPVHPAGYVELTDEELKRASGLGAIAVTTFITCTEFTFIRFRCCPKP